MRRLISTILIALFAILIQSCKSWKSDYPDDMPPFNPYVEAFTTGKVSRSGPIRLVFTQDIPEGKRDAKTLKKNIRFKPQTEGEFSLEDNRTVIFTPTKPLQRDTPYEVSADLSGWFKTGIREKEFSFRFMTAPFALRANLQSLKNNEKKPETYDIIVDFFSMDNETDELIESLINISVPVDSIRWRHLSSGKRHELTLSQVPYLEGKDNELIFSTKKNKHDIPVEELLKIQIPSPAGFTVYESQLINDGERYIEFILTQSLDPGQDLTGLVYIQGGSSKVTEEEIVSIDGNMLRIYPAANRKGKFQVILEKEIKSQSGLKLEERVIRSFNISEDMPKVEFIGKGTIIPSSSELIIPFQAVHLRAVTVRVIRIMENNVGQFLQVNQLDGAYQLTRVGRLITRKTIWLEDENVNLAEWNTFAVDLREMMEPEPGAIYRIELSITKDHSAYPCGEEPAKTKEQVLAQDAEMFERDIYPYDNGSYYYYYDYDYYDYGWDDARSDPCSSSYYSNKTIAKNVLATNLGIIAKRGAGDELLVFVRDILTTYAQKSAEVTVHNYQNEIIASGVTDDNGQVKIKLGTRVPFYVMARQGKQKTYLRLDGGNSLSLSSFDVDGEVVQKGIKGFIYGDRGVWRPGDTLFLSFMLNDRDKTLPESHPVIMELYNPRGQLYLKKTQTKGELGLYAFEMPTDPDVPTGAWRVEVKVGGAIFRKSVRIEAIKPNRLKINLAHPEDILVKGDHFRSKLHVEWLQGATARNLGYEIEGTFSKASTTFAGFKDFYFEAPTKGFNTEKVTLAKGKTDASGNADLQFKFEMGQASPGILSVFLYTRVYEESGDFSIDGDRLTYSPYKQYTGIKDPAGNSYYLQTEKDHVYEVASVDYKGKALAGRNLEVIVYKVEKHWWWSSGYKTMASYMENTSNEIVLEKTVTTNENGIGRFTFNAPKENWGSYFIRVKDPESGHIAAITNFYDWSDDTGHRYMEEGETSSPHLLRFATDKETYEPGETIRLTLPTTEGSRAIVSIENGSKVISVSEHYGNRGETVIELTATEEMQPNVFANVTLLQPHANTNNDLPIRLYGIAPFKVNSPKSHLNPVIKVANELKPEQPYEVTVSEKDGREMAYTIAIVDEGLLDLTRFKTPDPWAAFNAKEALGVTTWDIYNYIVGAYGGRIEQIFSIGGDDNLLSGPNAVVNRFKPVVQFEGPFLLKKGEKTTHRFNMPNYNGRVRMMVVAGDGSAYGNTETSVMVRKPVMILGTLPRVIGVREEMVIPATVFATEEGVGHVKVSISCSNNMEIIGNSVQDLTFTQKEDKQATFRIRVKNQAGAGRVTLTATAKGEKSVYETDIEIRSVYREQTRSRQVILQPGETFKESITFHGAAGTNSLDLDVSRFIQLNLSTRLPYLLGYPHGCLEQIVSKAFPQLYLKQFTDMTPKQIKDSEDVVKSVISRLRSYQMPSGAFAYWPGGTSSTDWGSIYATHFLLEAEAQGYAIPDGLKKNALTNLRQLSRSWQPHKNNPYLRSDEFTQAYRLYLLAFAQSAEIGAMNRLKEADKKTYMTRWTLAAAYALVGRTDVAATLADQTVPFDSYDYRSYDNTYGSNLRDKAICLQTQLLLNRMEEATRLAKEISDALSNNQWLSTQTIAFGLKAMGDYFSYYTQSDKMQFEYSSGGKSDKINSDAPGWSGNVLKEAGVTAPLEIVNKGHSTIYAQITTTGTPDQGTEEAYSKDIRLQVEYVDVNNQPIDVENIRQGTNFTAVVTIKNPTNQGLRNLALTQVFPAGWEILNTRFLPGSGENDGGGSRISYQDIRDDRVYSYIDYLEKGKQIKVTINLCAVYPGNFYLPPVWCEAMYDNEITANTKGRRINVKI